MQFTLECYYHSYFNSLPAEVKIKANSEEEAKRKAAQLLPDRDYYKVIEVIE